MFIFRPHLIYLALCLQPPPARTRSFSIQRILRSLPPCDVIKGCHKQQQRTQTVVSINKWLINVYNLIGPEDVCPSFCCAGPVGLDALQEAACAAKMMFGLPVCYVLCGGGGLGGEGRVRRDGRRRGGGGWQA